nr:hypothetical protein [Pseudomonadota bacterium]
MKDNCDKSDFVSQADSSEQTLQGVRVLLAVSGSIAVFKACYLARRLVSAGADLQVLMTDSATWFVQPLSFQYISRQPVLPNRFEGADAVDHIRLARWAQLMVIAPASANRISRLALGLADDLLGVCVLATGAPIVLAPAMNQQMWRQDIIGQHIETLRARSWHIAAPESGAQACGETGPGRMMEVDNLLPHIVSVYRRSSDAGADHEVDAESGGALATSNPSSVAGAYAQERADPSAPDTNPDGTQAADRDSASDSLGGNTGNSEAVDRARQSMLEHTAQPLTSDAPQPSHTAQPSHTVQPLTSDAPQPSHTAQPSARAPEALRCLITLGATIEDIDPVRFLSNRSSGRMGLALFEALHAC